MDMVALMYKHVCGATVSSAALGFAHLLVCPAAGIPIAPPKYGAMAVHTERRLKRKNR